LKLNFGGIGKGYALDRAAECLRTNWGITRALLHGGGSSVYGLGAPPNDVRGWPVAIRHPWEPDQSLGTVWLRNRGLGTSAATFQFFEYNGKKYGHLLNPLTGEPALGTASASCVAPSAAVADALSTAMFVRGADWATDYLRSRPHLHSVILRDES
jgi:thiamine biosynthesis lipoprotein